MFSYAGIIQAVLIRRVRYFDRTITRLQVMAAIFREAEDSHATHLALLYCLYGQMQIVVVYQQYYWSVFRRLVVCCEVFYIS